MELPVNIEAERTVLGANLLRNELTGLCAESGLRPDHFSLSTNGEIYGVQLRLHNEGRPFDTCLLLEEMDVAKAGGFDYLSDLTRDVVLLESHVLQRCRVLILKSKLRKVVAVTAELQAAACELGAKPEVIIKETIEKLNAILED
ncbi:MAG TPA: DnaB-like helicase N-terminal domain-containing protein [Terriglobales bacterium]|nr:DnaB-like helicase N-terminal domain-containing protein [Terriglobales bacterium]